MAKTHLSNEEVAAMRRQLKSFSSVRLLETLFPSWDIRRCFFLCTAQLAQNPTELRTLIDRLYREIRSARGVQVKEYDNDKEISHVPFFVPQHRILTDVDCERIRRIFVEYPGICLHDLFFDAGVKRKQHQGAISRIANGDASLQRQLQERWEKEEAWEKESRNQRTDLRDRKGSRAIDGFVAGLLKEEWGMLDAISALFPLVSFLILITWFVLTLKTLFVWMIVIAAAYMLKFLAKELLDSSMHFMPRPSEPPEIISDEDIRLMMVPEYWVPRVFTSQISDRTLGLFVLLGRFLRTATVVTLILLAAWILRNGLTPKRPKLPEDIDPWVVAPDWDNIPTVEYQYRGEELENNRKE